MVITPRRPSVHLHGNKVERDGSLSFVKVNVGTRQPPRRVKGRLIHPSIAPSGKNKNPLMMFLLLSKRLFQVCPEEQRQRFT